MPPGVVNSMYHAHRAWIKDLLFVQGGHQNPVEQLFERAISILQSVGAVTCESVRQFNAYQLVLLLFKDMGLGGILSTFVSRTNDPETGGFDGFLLPEPISTRYKSFYDDCVVYIRTAERDAVLAAQIESPGSQVTIGFIATVLQEAEINVQEKGVTLQEYLGHGAIADLVEQYNKKDNAYWLNANDFFMGDNGGFTTIRVVSESSLDIVVGEPISSDATMIDLDGLDALAQQAVDEIRSCQQPLKLRSSQQQQQLLHPVLQVSVQDFFLEPRFLFLF